MKLEKISLEDQNIPENMRNLVEYLNKVCRLDSQVVTKLLDVPTVYANMAKFDAAFSYMVFRGEDELSGLGLLSGFVNTEKYRLYAEFEHDIPPYGNIIGFGVFEVKAE